jgi:hypothetical protein
VAICDADGDGHIDHPFIDNQTFTIGDNHRGYPGYMDIMNKSRIINNGAINVIVDSWNNITRQEMNQNLISTSLCQDSSNP